MDQNEQTLTQKKIALAQSEHASTIIELMKDCARKTPIVAKTEWETIVNAITLEVQGTMMKDMVDYLDSIRKGGLHEQK